MNQQTYIRLAERNDLPAIHKLIEELAIFERAPQEFTLTLNQLEKDFDSGSFTVFVAIYKGAIAGMALLHETYSTWKGKCVYLEDLIVTEKYRRTGIGSLLFNQSLTYAKEQGYHRLKWQVLDWNTPAIEFYKKYTCTIENEWLNCKLTKEGIAEAVARLA